MIRIAETYRVLLLLTPLLVSALALPQQAPPRKVIGTGTRQVAQFSALESELISAATKKDQPAISKLLADDFEEWTPASTEGPVTRERWIQRHLGKKYANFRLRNMAVHMFGDTHVVNFVLRLEPAAGGPATEVFIVDVWTPASDNSGNWQLRVRYASPGSGFAIPTKTRPTGKE